jgi:hypothetical protein
MKSLQNAPFFLMMMLVSVLCSIFCGPRYASADPVTKNTREVILLGKKAGLASELITQADLAAAGTKGAVVRGLDGRIAIAASNESKTGMALEAFLHIIRVRHGGPSPENGLPQINIPIIREFTLIDWPPFGPSFFPGWGQKHF